MSSNKSHQEPQAVVNSIETNRHVMDQAKTGQKKAETGSQAKIRQLKAQLEESEKLRISAEVKLEVSENVSRDTIQALKTRLTESEVLRAVAENEVKKLRDSRSTLNKRLKFSKAQVENLEEKLDSSTEEIIEMMVGRSMYRELYHKCENELKVVRSEADSSKLQAQAELTESEGLRTQAAQSLAQEKEQQAKLKAKYNKEVKTLRDELAEAKALIARTQAAGNQIQRNIGPSQMAQTNRRLYSCIPRTSSPIAPSNSSPPPLPVFAQPSAPVSTVAPRTCVECGTTVTPRWRSTTSKDSYSCNACYCARRKNNKADDSQKDQRKKRKLNN